MRARAACESINGRHIRVMQRLHKPTQQNHLIMQSFQKPSVERFGPSLKVVARSGETVEARAVTVQLQLNGTHVGVVCGHWKKECAYVHARSCHPERCDGQQNCLLSVPGPKVSQTLEYRRRTLNVLAVLKC
jgi:hypothetical protein